MALGTATGGLRRIDDLMYDPRAS